MSANRYDYYHYVKSVDPDTKQLVWKRELYRGGFTTGAFPNSSEWNRGMYRTDKVEEILWVQRRSDLLKVLALKMKVLGYHTSDVQWTWNNTTDILLTCSYASYAEGTASEHMTLLFTRWDFEGWVGGGPLIPKEWNCHASTQAFKNPLALMLLAQKPKEPEAVDPYRPKRVLDLD